MNKIFSSHVMPFRALIDACWKEKYTAARFTRDLIAGITVGIIAIPLAMALAIGSGVAPQYGLYTAAVAGIVIALTGGSRFSVSLERCFARKSVPSDEAVKPYLYGLCREYASRIDGNGNLREYGWWYEDVIKAIAEKLPDRFGNEVERSANEEIKAIKPEKTYYAVTEQDGEWRLCGIDNYDTKVTYSKFRTEEKRDKYIKDMLLANSDLQFEEISYGQLKEITNEMKAKREEFISQDREVFLEKRMEEEKSKETSDASVALLPDYTLREDGTLSVENLKDGMYKVRRETAEVLRGLLPVYNIEPNGSERRIGTEENLLMGSWKLGVKARDWKDFLESDKSLPYLSARYLVTDAAHNTVHYDANSGEVTKKPYSLGADGILRTELRELYAVMEERGTSPAGKMQPYVDGIMAE